VLVGTTRGAIGAGRSRTLVLKLNRAGRRLLAHAPDTLAVRVVVTSGGTKIATRDVQVLRP
jgi:molybdopterin biosynthesis enzyme MoaB